MEAHSRWTNVQMELNLRVAGSCAALHTRAEIAALAGQDAQAGAARSALAAAEQVT